MRISMGMASTLQAERDPAHPALTLDGETLSRLEFDRAANQMARALQAIGVRQDDLVAIVLPTVPDHQIAAFALWKIGATPVPLPPKAPPAELRALVEAIGPVLVIGVDAAILPGFNTLPAGYVPDPALDDAPLPSCVASRWKAATSGGSTGRHKVILDRQPSLVDPDQTHATLRIPPNSAVLHPAPAYHNAPFCQTNWALCWGCHVVLMGRFDAVKWLELVEWHRVEWAYLVPTMMRRILALPEADRARYDVSSLRVVMHMAAPCPPWLKRAWIEWLGPERIFEVYGGTEAFGGTLIDGVEWLAHPGSVGQPLHPLRILDDAGVELPAGEVGGIYFNPGPDNGCDLIGAAIMRYGDWASYGDIGWVDEEGYLYLSDRRTDMIVSAGVNLYPAEIEAALESHPEVMSAAVIGLPDPDLGQVAHAIIEPRAGEVLTLDEVHKFLSPLLSRTKLPRSIEYVPGPLRDEAGKLRRFKLREERIAAREQALPVSPILLTGS